jgi:hypothetical protein
MDEERNQLEAQRQQLDDAQEAAKLRSVYAIEQGRLDEAFASRQNEFNIQRMKAQLDLRRQNMDLTQQLLANPLLFPALQAQGGLGNILQSLQGMPAMQAPSRQVSMRGQALPFNPAAAGGGNLNLSDWNRFTPTQQAFMYDQNQVPIGTQLQGGEMVGGGFGGGGAGAGMDPQRVMDLMARAYPLASLDQASSRPRGKLIQQRG